MILKKIEGRTFFFSKNDQKYKIQLCSFKENVLIFKKNLLKMMKLEVFRFIFDLPKIQDDVNNNKLFSVKSQKQENV